MISSDTSPNKGKDDYHIHLNFLPVEMSAARCVIYRRKCASPQEQRPAPQASAHKLPAADPDEKEWESYWVLAEAADGFEAFDFQPTWNADITRRIIFGSLKRSIESQLKATEYRFPENSFIQEVSLVMQTHPEGEEELVVQPYSLKASRQTGFLVDFHFKLGKNVPFSRRIQQLSLSLDKNFRRNVDHYVDRSSKIRRFLETRWSIFEGMTLPDGSEPLRISKEFVALPAERLRPKVYVFAGDKESKSQFTGLRDFGPLQPLNQPPRLLFVFREQDRQAARRLALSLKGLKQRGQFNFPGFKDLFKSALDIDANPVVLPDLSVQSMESALKRAEAVRNDSPQVLPVIVLPNDENNGYLAQKAHFSHAGMPTQVCTLRILEDEESLKWAIGNLALQIFCKAGGKPWKVRPTAEHSLIIGISQSHKCRVVDKQLHIDKYFAFSVLTDSSGLFQQIQVLGDSEDHHTYISALRANLKRVLEESAGIFNRVVIHTSFKLKHEEMTAIQQTTHDVAAATDRAKCRFSVIKVNHKSRFFGINRAVNSLVPFEATKVRLGPYEHLVWFEGIYPDKPNVTKAFPGPTHLQFLRVNDDAAEPIELAPEDNFHFLRIDALNLLYAEELLGLRTSLPVDGPVQLVKDELWSDVIAGFHIHEALPVPRVAGAVISKTCFDTKLGTMQARDGRKAALDMRLVDPYADPAPDTKIGRAVHRIAAKWRDTRDTRLTQLVFCDLSTPNPKQFNVYDELRGRLIASGIPEREIAFIHDADSDADKMKLFTDVNAGRVRILIGSTEKMGAGTNVQKRLAALHHLDAPWRPRDIEQREGRILRQGNTNDEVEIHRYVTEGSFDAYMWQTLETKARFIQQVMSGQTSVRTAEDLEGGALTYAEIKAIASGNPAVMEKVKVDTEIRKLDQLRSAHLNQQHNIRWQIRDLPERIAEANKNLAHLREDIATRDAHDGEFSMIVGREEFSGKGAREEAAKVLTEAVLSSRDDPTLQPRASFRGFEILSRGQRLTGLAQGGEPVPELFIRGKGLYSANLNPENPLGTMQSIEHALRWLDRLAEQEQERGLRLDKTLADYQAQAGRPFDHEARMKDLLARQAQLNAALDLDKNEKQVAPPAEDEIGLAGESLPQLTPPPKLPRASAPSMSP